MYFADDCPSIKIENVKKLSDKYNINMQEALLKEGLWLKCFSEGGVDFRKQRFDIKRLNYGNRWYFRCLDCACLVRILYLKNNKLSCRKCQGLKYQSSSLHGNPAYELIGKHVNRIHKIETELTKRIRKDKRKKLSKEYEELNILVAERAEFFVSNIQNKVDRFEQMLYK
jgi:hypothetical protein